MPYREDEDIRINNKQCRAFVLKENKILVMYRIKNGKEYYVFPGGHMEDGEKPVDTVIREVFEETTVKIKDIKPAFELTNHSKKEIQYEYYFVCNWEEGIPTLSGEESRRCSEENFYKPMWVNISELKDLTTYSLAAKEWVMTNLQPE